MNKAITGTIEATTRRQNTVGGNPRWTIRMNGNNYNTKDDTACAYRVSLGDVGRAATLDLDGRGQVIVYDSH